MKNTALISRHLCAVSVVLLVLLVISNVAAAATTSLLLDSEPGDFIGQGQLLLFGSADGTFSAHRNSGNGVSLAFNTPSFSHFWFLDFAASNGQPLVLGSYTGATRFPFEAPNQPGLDVSGDGRGCNTLTGSFEVKEIAYGSGDEIVAFRATFEQHCEDAIPALRGEVRFNATVPIELAAPSAASVTEGLMLAFDVTATDTEGRDVALSATGLPNGASFADNGNNTGSFSWTPTTGQAGAYIVTFHGDNGQGGVETTFTQITVLAPPPPNDDFDGAMVIPGVPFTFTQDTGAATTAIDDPSCFGRRATVWFAFTPADTMSVEANTFGSDYDTTLAVYTGTRGALSQIGCNDNTAGFQSRVRFEAQAGVTYFVLVSAPDWSQGGNLVLNVVPGPPPLAVSLTLAPFDSVRLTAGTATVTGTVICSRPVFSFITGQLTQTYEHVTLTGFFTAFVNCDGKTPWSATVQVSPTLLHGRSVALFVGGRANVSASAVAFDFDTGESVQSSAAANVTLRGAP